MKNKNINDITLFRYLFCIENSIFNELLDLTNTKYEIVMN